MPDFDRSDEGKTIKFTVNNNDYYGVLTFIGIHPFLIDEEGRLWRFEGDNVFRVSNRE
jgi:hypothetical protein